MIHVDFKMFIDRPGVMRRISAKQQRVLAKTGRYAQVAMQRQIRPPRRAKKLRTVDVNGVPCLVPVHGMVVDSRTGKPVRKEIARQARIALAAKLRDVEAGKPPRRGPTDLLRKFIFFGLDEASESVVIGPMKFAKQPAGISASSVPELLEFGGTMTVQDVLGGQSAIAHYAPHPFVGPTLPIAERKFRELIESEPL
jgi:hypothetical protein